MFAGRYFPGRYFAKRYFPGVGSSSHVGVPQEILKFSLTFKRSSHFNLKSARRIEMTLKRDLDAKYPVEE